MELRLQRFSGKSDDTLGLLFDDRVRGLEFLCFILEDEARAEKVKGETRIPAGRYQIKLRPVGEGKLNEKYAERYDFHKGMLWLQDVPNFEWVYIHTGNDESQTEGCLLVGDVCEQNITERGRVGASRSAYSRIYPPIANAIENGEEVWITVRDEANMA